MQFIDKSKIRIVSGRGGNGMVAWRREKYVDKGGPAGGDGGRGGDVYLVADEGMSTLMDFKYKSVYKAPSGENGGIKNCHGACAKDLYIKVPVGTLVRDIKTGNVIADLTKNEQTVMVAKGGRGGRGNARFATAQKRAPQFCEPGEPGIGRGLFTWNAERRKINFDKQNFFCASENCGLSVYNTCSEPRCCQKTQR